jgi:hypothetical protein
VAALQTGIDNVRSDKPCTPGDNDFHALCS